MISSRNRSLWIGAFAAASLVAAPLFADPPAKKPQPEKSRPGASAKPGSKPEAKPSDDTPDAKASPKSDAKPAPNAKGEAGASKVSVVDREKLAREFAERHHPELGDLLAMLQPMNPDAYDAAIRDIARVAERLEPMETRDADRYRREIDVWKARSRVHVVSAEYRLAPSPDLEKCLRTLMQEELSAKRELLKLEREKAERRLDQIDREIARLEKEGDAGMDREIERLTKKPTPPRKEKPSGTKPKDD